MQDTSSLSETIGGRVCRLRSQYGLTTMELAYKVGVSQAQISRLENGRQGFRTVTLEKIAKALGVHLIYFFMDSDSMLYRALMNPKFLRATEKAAIEFVEGTRPVIITIS